MPIPAHRRITFSGIFGKVTAPIEAWSFRLNMRGEAAGVTGATYLATALAAYTTHVAPWTRGMVRLQEVKYASIDDTGHYFADPFILAADVAGNSAETEGQPLQVALAVSLRTAQRGASGRGRYYLPGPTPKMQVADGLIAAGEAGQLTTAQAAFLSALNAPADFGNIVVASSKGLLTDVTSIRVGRVLDTIRSRRTSQNETYSVPVAVNP